MIRFKYSAFLFILLFLIYTQMNQQEVVPNTLPKIELSCYELVSSQAEVAIGRKIYQYKRKSDQKKYRAISIPDKARLEAFMLYITRISGSGCNSFLKFVGWTKLSEKSNEPQTHLFFFENFDTSLRAHIKAHSLTNMDLEDLYCALLDSIDSFEQFTPTLLPLFTPENIVTVHTNGKKSFKILDMYIFDKIEADLNFEMAKWTAPELYQAILFRNEKYAQISRKESLIYSAGLITLYASTGYDFIDNRKKITKNEDFEAAMVDEIYKQTSSLKEMSTRHNYDQESIFCQIIAGSLKLLNERITLDEAKEYLRELGHSPIEWPSFEEERQVLSPSRNNSMTMSLDRSFSRLVSLTKKKVSQYELVSSGKHFSRYRENIIDKTFMGVNYTLTASDNIPSHDPYIIQLARQNNLNCPGLLKYEGYFFKSEDSNEVVLLFENHEGSASEYFQENRITPSQIIELCSIVPAWLDFLHINKNLLPSYLTPKNIVVASSNPLTFKLAGLKLGLDSSNEDWIWLSPEHYSRMKGSSGEILLDKPLVYSMGLTILDIILQAAVGEERLRLTASESSKFQTKEAERLNVVLEDLKQILGAKLDEADSKEAKAYKMLTESLLPDPSKRCGLFGWTRSLPSSISPDVDVKEHVIDMNRSLIKIERLKRSEFWDQCLEGPKELCNDWFEQCWVVYGICCGMVVSTFIIMMSFVAS